MPDVETLKPAAVLFLASALVGALMPIQSAANARVSTLFGSTIWAAAASFAVASACIAAALLLTRTPPPTLSLLRDIPLWTWSGGLIGAAIVFSGIVLLPRIGVSAFMATVIAGQLVSGAVIDLYGLFGVTAQPLNGWRAAGLVCIAAGALAVAVGSDRGGKIAAPRHGAAEQASRGR